MQSATPYSKSLDDSHRPSGLPSHLHNRAGIYYFRLVMSERLRLKFKRVEIRISLRTAYRRKALELSGRFYVYFHQMAENDPMISYKELRRRLNIYLQYQLEADYNCVLPRRCSHEIVAHKNKHLIWTAAKKEAAFLAYLVAMPRHCFK